MFDARSILLSRQKTCFCRDKTFVAAPANNMFKPPVNVIQRVHTDTASFSAWGTANLTATLNQHFYSGLWPKGNVLFTTFFTCCVSMPGRCHMLCWADWVERCCTELFHAAICCVGLSELSGVVLSCFTLPYVVLGWVSWAVLYRVISCCHMLCWAEWVERCCMELFHAAICCVGLSELSGVVLSCFTLPYVVLGWVSWAVLHWAVSRFLARLFSRMYRSSDGKSRSALVTASLYSVFWVRKLEITVWIFSSAFLQH